MGIPEPGAMWRSSTAMIPKWGGSGQKNSGILRSEGVLGGIFTWVEVPPLGLFLHKLGRTTEEATGAKLIG